MKKEEPTMPDRLPEELSKFSQIIIVAMRWLNGFAHIIIGLSLAISVLMFTWLFFAEVKEAIYAHNLVHGFLHALGTLMLLWSISALISAEIRYLQGGKLEVETFVEVAMVVVLRKVIVMPVQEITPTTEELVMWVGASLVLGILFVLVRWGRKLFSDKP
ncbi:MAG: phosphate-starvation-inducible PsiE family protein, partial [Methylophilaceae bacterium]|nr:phosphate-starvation-inducible PsiE family protein [Methylophilaceae bacterium]